LVHGPQLEPLYYNSEQLPNEALRIAERTTRLPGSDVVWQFVVARSRDELDQTTLADNDRNGWLADILPLS
jgi:hypothetical protein